MSARKSDRSMIAAMVLYAVTIGLGIGGAVQAAFGNNLPAVILGSIAFGTAVLCIMAFRAAHEWRKVNQ